MAPEPGRTPAAPRAPGASRAPGDLPLGPDPATLARWFDLTRDELVRFVAELAHAPSWDHEGVHGVVDSFREAAPEEGRPYEDVLARLRPAFAKALHTSGPGYL